MGADPDAVDDGYRSALHVAAATGNTELCTFFIEQGASVDRPEVDTQVTTSLGTIPTVPFLLFSSLLWDINGIDKQ